MMKVVDEMKKKGSLARWGNQIGYVFHALKIGVQKNPVEYVYSAKRSMDRKKASLESHFSYSFTNIILKLFGIQVYTYRCVCLYICIHMLCCWIHTFLPFMYI